jgi:hypothetical protein
MPHTIRSSPDLNIIKPSILVLLNVDVDRKMCINVSHLVFEAFRDTDDEVVDYGLDCSEGCDVFAGTMVDLD